MAEPAVAEPAADPGEITLKTFGDISPEAFDKVFPVSAADRVAAEPVTTAEPAAPAATVPAAEPVAAPAKPAVEGEVPDEIFGEPAVTPTPEAAAEIKVPDWIKKPKDIESWKQLHSKADQAVARAVKAESRIRELETKPPPADEGLQARLSQLETENKTLREKATAADIQSDEGFQQHFVAGRQQMVSTAASIAKRAGIEPGVVESALALTGDQRIQALDEITESITSPTLKTQLSNLAGQIESLDQQKAAVLADSPRSWERLQQQRAAENYQRQKDQEANLGKVFDGATDYLREKAGFEVLKKVPGDDNHWWNKQADQIVEQAREFLFKTTDQSQIALMPLLAATSGIHRGLWLKERAARIAAQKENAEFKGAEPGLNGRQREDGSGEIAADKNLGFAEAAARISGLP